MSFSISQTANPIEFFGLRGIRFGFGQRQNASTEPLSGSSLENEKQRPLNAKIRNESLTSPNVTILEETDSQKTVGYTSLAEPVHAQSQVGILLDLYA